ncbi:glutaredoxin family protein [Leeia sp. TBRC 13508]|uniref:Glutaredoxin family protein n=1 Tax=Leeia speluncae TaxID=2884804 RepID=A0ABS8D222_9NEIS|nr:glutaredoxin family protein [Leeia speluncae]MCB6182249.1 glutaredoxin family protein [Leeia speluncae]
MNKPTLTLYVKEYCSLCQEMFQQLQSYSDRITLTVVDIDDDDELEEKYAQLIPVLMSAEGEICHYHLHVQRLDAYLSKIG